MPTFATPAPITAAMQVAGAQVRVTASDRTDTVVLVEPINEASASDLKVASKTEVGFAGGQLTVKTTVSGDKRGSVAIAIDLPADSRLVANLAYSSVHADGPLGACELHMASGQVQLDHIDALQANIAAGEVAIGHIAGRAGIDGGALADPHHESPAVDVGPPGDVADRDLTGCDVRLQRVDAVQLDLTRCHVQLAPAECAVNLNARVRQVRGQAGAGGQVDRDGDRAALVPGGGRLDR